MQKNDKISFEKDFGDFMAVEPIEVPSDLFQAIQQQVQNEFRPSAFKVFAKLALVQFLVGGVTLLFCPQFGISLTSSMGLMPLLMKFGDGICMVGCGALFTGLSFLVASFALKPEEVHILKRHKILQVVSLATLSLGAFLCIGGEVVLTLGLIWLIGSTVGGILTLEIGWKLRKFFAQKRWT